MVVSFRSLGFLISRGMSYGYHRHDSRYTVTCLRWTERKVVTSIRVNPALKLKTQKKRAPSETVVADV